MLITANVQKTINVKVKVYYLQCSLLGMLPMGFVLQKGMLDTLVITQTKSQLFYLQIFITTYILCVSLVVCSCQIAYSKNLISSLFNGRNNYFVKNT